MHGPGCPVCVTPLEMIDRAHASVRQPEVICCSFGDMLCVPGSHGDLFQVNAGGAGTRWRLPRAAGCSMLSQRLSSSVRRSASKGQAAIQLETISNVGTTAHYPFDIEFSEP